MAIVTPTDSPKSVRNCCLIEHFWLRFCVINFFLWIFCWYRGFCHWTESDLFLFQLQIDISEYGKHKGRRGPRTGWGGSRRQQGEMGANSAEVHPLRRTHPRTHREAEAQRGGKPIKVDSIVNGYIVSRVSCE